MRIFTSQQQWIYFLAAICLGVSCLTAQVNVVARFNPSTATLGQAIRYEISIEGTQQSLAGEMPAVEGLQINPRPSTSTQSSTQIINGRVTSTNTLTYSFNVQALREGRFVMPRWTAQYGGQDLIIPAANLNVVPAGEQWREAVLFELAGVPEQVYTGQAIAAELILLFRPEVDVSLGGAITKQGDAFSDWDWDYDNLPSRNTMRGGVAYRAVRIPFVLTPLRAGPATLEYQIPLNVRLPDPRGRQRSPMGGFFRDPFSRGQLLQRVYTTGEIEIEVLDPPPAGQPAGFAGAIGQYQLRAEIPEGKWRVGEAVELSLIIEGEGNFDRLGEPRLLTDDNWRSYPPKTRFEQTDELGLRGRKRFDYILLPRNPGELELPIAELVSYDPESGEYVVLRTEPTLLEVTEAAPGTVLPETAPISNQDNLPRERDLLPLAIRDSAPSNALIPLWKTTAFWQWQAGVGAVLAFLTVLGWWSEKRSSDFSGRRRQELRKAMQEAIQSARKAAQANEASAFYAAAGRALQVKAALWMQHRGQPEALGSAEVIAAFQAHGEEAAAKEVSTLYQAAEASQFGGLSGASLETDWQRLQCILQAGGKEANR